MVMTSIGLVLMTIACALYWWTNAMLERQMREASIKGTLISNTILALGCLGIMLIAKGLLT